MIYSTYNFNYLPASKLLPHLQAQFDSALSQKADADTLVGFLDQTDSIGHEDWHLCWLNNDDEPVIGLLPKVAWRLLPIDTQLAVIDSDHLLTQQNPVKVIKSQRAIEDTAPTYRADSTVSTYKQWQAELITYCKIHDTPYNKEDNECVEPVADHVITAGYTQGLMGFIGYDISAQQLSPNADIELADQPCAFLGHYDIYLEQNQMMQWQIHYQPSCDSDALLLVHSQLSRLEARLTASLLPPSLLAKRIPESLSLTHCWQLEDYKQAFEKTQQALYRGDSYQINLTQKWQGSLSTIDSHSIDPSKQQSNKTNNRLLDYLPPLIQSTQAPFSGYLSIQSMCSSQTFSKFELLSCSPELFAVFKKQPDQNDDGIRVITKPIKGTRPRGDTPEQDAYLKTELLESEKDRAENVMIVDLLRNDLGKYATTGSVTVPKLFAIESFSNVHHMISTVEATVKNDVHPLTVLFGSLPAGSITGTPKKRAVEIISELEISARGAYCGTMGYLNFDGTGQWNVLIRTLQAYQNKVCLWAGGGITVGSECEAEYQECVDKVGNLLAILQNPNGST